MALVFNPSTLEEDAGRSLSSIQLGLIESSRTALAVTQRNGVGGGKKGWGEEVESGTVTMKFTDERAGRDELLVL